MTFIRQSEARRERLSYSPLADRERPLSRMERRIILERKLALLVEVRRLTRAG